MPRVLASTQIRQRRPGDLGQPESLVQLAVRRKRLVNPLLLPID
jgi:hypothetical protein